MAKKYLTIEEAAELLGVETGLLSRMREKGEIRAFADRGNWKFREDDVQELSRKLKTDSDPDVPIFRAPPKPPQEHEITLNFDDEPLKSDGTESSIILGSEADESLGEQPTIVRKGGLDDLMGSDSDVRLVYDDSLLPAPGSDSDLSSQQSDSDVRLIGAGSAGGDGSDSDVKLVPDTSSVKTPGSDDGSDSDVTLISGHKSDPFTLDLDQSDGSFVLGGESSGIALEHAAAQEEGSDSGITLDLPNDSGIALQADDSGISFVTGDSGIALDPGSGIALDAGSGITLDNGSGISLDVGSGISLASDDSSLVLAGDSGISLGGPSDSGIALEGLAGDSKPKNKNRRDDLGGTMPSIPTVRASDDDMAATTMEVPMLADPDSEFEFNTSALDDDSSGSVVLPAERPGRGKKKPASEDSDMFDSAATTEFASDDDDSGAVDVFEDESDEMEVADDIVGEDDEVIEDVFGAGDEDFDEELQSGQSSADFVVPSIGAARVAAPVQAEWGTGTFAMLLVSSAVMLLTSLMMYDVVHTMWGNNEPNAGTEIILSSLRGMFG